jgi:hypothetical protein
MRKPPTLRTPRARGGLEGHEGGAKPGSAVGEPCEVGGGVDVEGGRA